MSKNMTSIYKDDCIENVKGCDTYKSKVKTEEE